MQNSLASFIIKIVGTGLVFLQAILLARILGVKEYGIYTYVMAWVSLLVPLAIFGQDRLLVRNLAIYQSHAKWGLMHGQLRWSNQIILLVSLTVAILGGMVAWFFSSLQNTISLTAFWIGCGLVIVVAFSQALQSALQGLQHVIVGQMSDMVFRPILIILLFGGTLLLFTQPDAVLALGFTLIATSITLVITGFLLLKFLPNEIQIALPVYEQTSWFSSALPIVLVGMTSIANNRLSILTLGALHGTELVGIFAVVSRGTDLLVFMLQAVNISLGPIIANLHSKNDMDQLQQLITRGSRLIFSVTLIGTTMFLLGGHWFLLLFGKDFSQGQTALTILSIGQLVNASAGSAGILLIMTGYEREVAISVGVGLGLNVLLNLLLVPSLDINGAALAQSMSLITWNILVVVRSYQILGIHSTVFGDMGIQKRI